MVNEAQVLSLSNEDFKKIQTWISRQESPGSGKIIVKQAEDENQSKDYL